MIVNENSTQTATRRPKPPRDGKTIPNGSSLQIRFAAIWAALAILLIVGLIVAPRSVAPTSLIAILPMVAFLAVAAMGQGLVMMSRGIDLSVPAVMALSSSVLLGVSGGSNESVLLAVFAALLISMFVGLVNGVLIGILRLNALIVTLSMGAIVSGITLAYRQSLPQESGVPPILAEFGSAQLIGINSAIWLMVIIVIILSILLQRSAWGRMFLAVGSNPRSAHLLGMNVEKFQVLAFVLAGLLYGIVGVMVSAFIRNPTLEIGAPYLLGPIAVAVLAGTAISGGIGRMSSIVGAAMFMVLLTQILKMLGLSTAYQLIIEGMVIAIGVSLAGARKPNFLKR